MHNCHLKRHYLCTIFSNNKNIPGHYLIPSRRVLFHIWFLWDHTSITSVTVTAVTWICVLNSIWSRLEVYCCIWWQINRTISGQCVFTSALITSLGRTYVTEVTRKTHTIYGVNQKWYGVLWCWTSVYGEGSSVIVENRGNPGNSFVRPSLL